MTILIAIVLLGVGVILIYNKLIRLRLLLKEAFSGVDVQLKRRHDLIPNIVQVVKGYSGHEQDLLTKVTELRSKLTNNNPMDDQNGYEKQLATSLKGILVLAEAYPELKADKNFQDLQVSLSSIEDELQLARRYFNGTVRNYNIAVQSFPSVLIAGMMQFKSEKFFEVDYATEREAPDVQFE